MSTPLVAHTVVTQRPALTTHVRAKGMQVDATPQAATVKVMQVTTGLTGPSGAIAQANISADWGHYATAVQYTGASASIASGTVLTASYSGSTIYRHITTALDANGYPVEDAFYSGFDGTSLTGLIVARGVI
jgi:hypothetical protein